MDTLTCRYAEDEEHTCADRDGRTPPRVTCYAEARAQLGAVIGERYGRSRHLVYSDGSSVVYRFGPPPPVDITPEGRAALCATHRDRGMVELSFGAKPGTVPDYLCDGCAGMFVVPSEGESEPAQIIEAHAGADLLRWFVPSRSEPGAYRLVTAERLPDGMATDGGGNPVAPTFRLRLRCSCPRGRKIAENVNAKACRHLRPAIRAGAFPAATQAVRRAKQIERAELDDADYDARRDGADEWERCRG